MLKITATETSTEVRFVVQGHLVGPWARELRRVWKGTHQSRDGRAYIIDLSDVALIDKSGQRLLRAMWKDGAELAARGVYTKGVLSEVEGVHRTRKRNQLTGSIDPVSAGSGERR